MNPIITQLLTEVPNATVEVQLRDGKLQWVVAGFAKSGNATLTENEDGTLTAMTRYGQTDTIDYFDDLLSLNNEWWRKSCSQTWGGPDWAWEEVLIKYGYVKVEVIEQKPIKKYS